ncbi:MAG: outer membrane beta-barrel protein [Bacteroidales bacterium]|nr:outer membrane beta-barrel protein [Bacteroidales bacterium]
MKKVVIILSAMLTLASASKAQDTIKKQDGKMEKASGVADTLRVAKSYSDDSIAYYVDNALAQLRRLFDSVGAINADMLDSLGAVLDIDNLKTKLNLKPYPRFGGNFSFYWGFHNWGDNRLNGLGKQDGAYNLRTSFSSYQLEYITNLKLNRHWMIGVGIAWESDCYKFKNPYVFCDATGNLNVGAATDIVAREGMSGAMAQPDVWNTKLVARYIEIPFRVGYTAGRFGRRVKMGLSVIPGFNYNGKHTGMKYSVEVDGNNHKRIDHTMDDFLNPFKCDLRFDVKRGLVGLFVQVSMVPVNKNMEKELFPFKIGLFI